MAKNPKWTEEELVILKVYYESSEMSVLLELLPNRNSQSIMIKGSRLGLYRMNYFSDEEIEIIKTNYKDKSLREISEMIGRSLNVVKNKVTEMGLRKQSKWSIYEIEILKKSISSFTVKHIQSKILKNRTTSSIYHIIQTLGLQKETKRYSSFSDEELISTFQKVCEEQGRTISVLELVSFGLPSYSTISKRFGSYNNFCELSNIKINTGYVSPYKNVSKNGEECLSNSEKIICDFLFDRNIKYEKEVPYSKIIVSYKGKFRSDWILENGTVIEFFGMSRHKKYKQRMKQKINLCRKNKITLIELYDKDLNNLEEKIIPFIKQNL